MALTEKTTDRYIANLLETAKISFQADGSSVKEIDECLRTGSKRGTGKQGFPEFTGMSGDFVIVVEDKASSEFQAKYINDDNTDTLLMDTASVTKYAENGALHYALHIIQNTSFKKVFAFGCSGTDPKRMVIRPIFVSPTSYKILPKVKDFSNFSDENIQRYYNEQVCGNEPIERVELRDILSKASSLHEDLWIYGGLGDKEKPLVVSAILLALKEETFSTEQLVGDSIDIRPDGKIIHDALVSYMKRVKVEPKVKRDRVTRQFEFIIDSPKLNTKNERLGNKTPLRYFAEYLGSNVLTAISNNSPEDVLGRFYGEFMSYSGGDGQTLGIVLTPKHITELFVDLAQIKPTDKVFDPTCGTGGFLIAAMHRMLSVALPEDVENIKKNNLHGIELKDEMFSIATTNMVLRGDGQSNLICEDFLLQSTENLREKNYTVGLMNPPYSQGKKKETSHLTELKFIIHLLDSLADEARCVVIVPQSTMVGKTKEDKLDKEYILENHTLEGVITLNTDTFYGVGTNPVIAVFTAHKPHPADKLAKFVDFKDDGYRVFAHVGLMATERADERKKLLLDCWFQGKAAPNSFIVRSTVEPDDEWLHSFYYFNEEIPDEKDFEMAMADYLTFEFNMRVHGRAYLFDDVIKENCVNEKHKSLNRTWKDFWGHSQMSVAEA